MPVFVLQTLAVSQGSKVWPQENWIKFTAAVDCNQFARSSNAGAISAGLGFLSRGCRQRDKFLSERPLLVQCKLADYPSKPSHIRSICMETSNASQCQPPSNWREKRTWGHLHSQSLQLDWRRQSAALSSRLADQNLGAWGARWYVSAQKTQVPYPTLWRRPNRSWPVLSPVWIHVADSEVGNHRSKDMLRAMLTLVFCLDFFI